MYFNNNNDECITKEQSSYGWRLNSGDWSILGLIVEEWEK